MNLFKLTELGEEVLATEICGVVDDVIAKSPSSVTSVTEVLQLSVATSPNSVGEVLQLSDDDVQINYRAPLGSGGFCNVYPVHLREPSGEFNTDKQPWALKKLQYLVLQNEIEAKSATADLRREAQLLSNLSHENLIQVYGVRKRDENDAQDSFAFFMVMNVLSDTLESKLETWTKNRGLFEKVVPAEAVGLRLRHVAIGIASGMEYLHSKRIIFR
jgi:serine/threonine protein kinase